MRVIYIDDDATNRLVVKTMLQPAGVTMAEASNVETGLRMIEGNEYALALVDLRMPGINGLTAIRQIRARTGSGRRVPVVVVSADLSPGVRGMCADAGADGFLEKPVEMAQLLAVIGAMLGKTAEVMLD